MNNSACAKGASTKATIPNEEWYRKRLFHKPKFALVDQIISLKKQLINVNRSKDLQIDKIEHERDIYEQLANCNHTEQK